MADGTAGSVYLDANSYNEAPGDNPAANHMNTDYAQQPSVKKSRHDAFHNWEMP